MYTKQCGVLQSQLPINDRGHENGEFGLFSYNETKFSENGFRIEFMINIIGDMFVLWLLVARDICRTRNARQKPAGGKWVGR